MVNIPTACVFRGSSLWDAQQRLTCSTMYFISGVVANAIDNVSRTLCNRKEVGYGPEAQKRS
jgi:hypothetical protein